MSHGLEVWDANGNLILSTSDRVGRYVTTYTVPQIPKRSGYTLSVPGYSPGLWYFSGKIDLYLDVTQNQNSLYFFNYDYYSASFQFTLRVYRS